MGAATRALQVLLEDCVAPVCASTDVAQQHQATLQKCFDLISSCLGYQYNKAWHQVLHVIAAMFKVSCLLSFLLPAYGSSISFVKQV